MIRFDDVSFGYNDKGGTVQHISFTLKKACITAIIGANGAGKSTVSKLMRGLIRPSSGRVFLEEQDMAGMKVSQLAARIGFLFQNPDRQICKNTVREELLFSLQFTVPDRDRQAACCEEVLAALCLNPDDDPMVLSRGERQRVAMATAMVHKPELLILDEPTTGLDYRECTEIMDYVRSLNRNGTTVAMVCHDMEIVQDYADEVLVMSAGRLIASGSTAAVFRNREILDAASLLPPQIVDLSLRLGEGYENISDVDGMAKAIAGKGAKA
ncbi:MAG: ATP-binding cassette domain-containing protein [Clostridia bacterium]|nr:ATP-binding cassette domain-containing protein [Clostridia bacterium]